MVKMSKESYERANFKVPNTSQKVLNWIEGLAKLVAVVAILGAIFKITSALLSVLQTEIFGL